MTSFKGPKARLISLLLCFCVSAMAQQNPEAVLASMDKDKDSGKKAVLDVAKKLEALLQPSEMAEYMKHSKKNSKEPPYVKIVKGKGGKSTLIYRCRNAEVKSLLSGIEGILSSTGSADTSEDQNMIIVNDTNEKISEIRDSLAAMDVVTPQILVEAKVVEVLCNEGMQRDVSLVFNRHDEKQNLNSTAGVQTAVPGQTAAEADKGGNFDWYPYIAGQIGDSNYKNFHATVQWLLTAESAKILSSPNVVVSRGATASIITGQDIPIQSFQVYTGSTTTSTTFKRVGVKLNVTPKLINNDYVMLQVNPEVSNVQRYQNIAQGGNNYQVPVIAIRNIETQLFLGDGQIVMIGGLYYNKDSSVQQRVPFLSDIPFMGELFTAKNDASDLTQLIFFLKINILADQDAASGIIYDPGKNAKILRSIGDVIKDSEELFPDKNKTSIEKLKEELIDKKY